TPLRQTIVFGQGVMPRRLPSDYQEKHFNSPDRVRGEKLRILLQYSDKSSGGSGQENTAD
ncbi:hypothetical protein, partial [Pseudomonas syringae]|uniref:hypothetical protein n=1 Tax=Pseudomonas syringae TaxID=317 RepID=UPI001E510C5E